MSHRFMLAGILGLVVGLARAEVEVTDTRPAMGTLLEITVVVGAEGEGRRLLEAAQAEVERLERIFSNWDPSSEVEALGARAGGDWMAISGDLARLLVEGRAVSEVTGGAFDLTVDAVTRSRRRGAVMSGEELEDRLGLVGYRGLELGERPRGSPVARLVRQGMGVDTGGIAKGYAVDRVVERLRAGGAIAGFVNFGRSSMAGFGPRDWPVLVPGSGETVALGGLSLSTSTCGPRGEVVDPRTGRPVEREGTVTVVTSSATVAEAWSKALLVLEPGSWPALPDGMRVVGGTSGVAREPGGSP